MKASVSVDYLSHEWSCTDLIQAHRELKRQQTKMTFNLNQQTATKKELKKFSTEKVRQIRYQNAIWRQMARSCTNKLSCSNQMIDPSSVNWQKESDITWLYGPLYMPPESSSDLNTHPSLSFLSTPTFKAHPCSLKPVLKKTNQSTQNVMLQKDYWLTNDRFWSKCVSESGKQSVRFNPNITQVKYLPETPVKESFKTKPDCYFNLDSEGEEDSEDEGNDEEDIWNVMIQVGSYLKSALFNSLFGKKKMTKQVIKTSNRDLVQFCVSAVSFTAWIMYQTFTTVFSRAPSFTQIKPQTQTKLKPASLLERKNNDSVPV
ncbi:hypothetical protein BD770DRAFT_415182 [Pilaira anomala]|nr:hypothetical protein BD770DRAFT_415182 [Pilaira anomala]